MKKKTIFGIVAILLVVMVVKLGSGSSERDKTEASQTNESSRVSKPAAKPKVPMEHTAALAKAKSYANHMNMSEAAVADQLASEYGEKFKPEAVKYAMDNLKDIDWNKNALEKAKSYQKHASMSTAAIKEQLTSSYGEKFTNEQAEYAISHLPA